MHDRSISRTFINAAVLIYWSSGQDNRMGELSKGSAEKGLVSTFFTFFLTSIPHKKLICYNFLTLTYKENNIYGYPTRL